MLGVLAGNSISSIVVTDDKGNTWTTYTYDLSTGSCVAIAFAVNIAAGATTVTATFSGNSAHDLFLEEVSGIKTSAAEDGHTAGTTTLSGGGTNRLCGSITTTAAGMTWGLLNSLGSALTLTPTGAYATIEENESAASGLGGTLIAANTSAGANNPSLTVSSDVNTKQIALALLDAAGGAAAPVRRQRRLMMGVG